MRRLNGKLGPWKLFLLILLTVNAKLSRMRFDFLKWTLYFISNGIFNENLTLKWMKFSNISDGMTSHQSHSQQTPRLVTTLCGPCWGCRNANSSTNFFIGCCLTSYSCALFQQNAISQGLYMGFKFMRFVRKENSRSYLIFRIITKRLYVYFICKPGFFKFTFWDCLIVNFHYILA